MIKTFVIIGTSAAGIGTAYRLRMLDAAARIICISDEAETPYNKCFIVEYLSGERELSQVLTLTPESAQQKNIECMLATRIIALHVEQKYIESASGEHIPYDALFLGMGCSPIVPDIDGIHGIAGVFTFYNVHDVHALHAYIKKQNVKKAIVIGAGLTGLEAADGLAKKGLEVIIIERASHVLPNQVDYDGAQIIHNHIQQSGISLHVQTSVVRIAQKEGAFCGVELADGTLLDADMLICAVGARPNSALAQKAGIVMQDGYVRVDEHMQTSVPALYAGGDIALMKDQITGELVPSCTWPDAMQQGMVAAYNMVGQQKLYAGSVVTVSSSFFGIKCAISGDVKSRHAADHRVEIKSGDGWYHLFVYKQNQLRGFMLIGNTGEFSQWRRTLMTTHQ